MSVNLYDSTRDLLIQIAGNGSEGSFHRTFENDMAEPQTPKMLPTNCKNCGAALHGYKCEYCGTTYN